MKVEQILKKIIQENTKIKYVSLREMELLEKEEVHLFVREQGHIYSGKAVLRHNNGNGKTQIGVTKVFKCHGFYTKNGNHEEEIGIIIGAQIPDDLHHSIKEDDISKETQNTDKHYLEKLRQMGLVRNANVDCIGYENCFSAFGSLMNCKKDCGLYFKKP